MSETEDTAIVVELMISRTLTLAGTSQKEKKYTITGTDDEDVAAEALKTAAGSSVGGSGTIPLMYPISWVVEPVCVIEGDGVGSRWTGTVIFQKPKPGQSGGDESVYNFDTGGGTKHITQSINTMVKRSVLGYPEVNHDGAIGVSNNNGFLNIEGCDIVSPVFSFSETHYLDDSVVTEEYKQTLCDLTGTVNTAGFKGFSAYEVLFLGASGSRRGDLEKWEITFKFSAQKNRTDVAVGSEMSLSTVNGWEYVWVEYDDKDSEYGTTKRPIRAFVEQVYSDEDFSALGIGGDEES
jgi:hypothetical protein